MNTKSKKEAEETIGFPTHKEIYEITEGNLKSFMFDLFRKKIDKECKRLIIGRYCKAHGYIMDDGTSIINYCSDPTCHNCNQFHELLAEEAKKYKI